MQLWYNEVMISGDDIIPRQTRVNKKRQRLDIVDHDDVRAIHSSHGVDFARDQNVMTLLSRGRRSAFFVTEDSHRYISQKQQAHLSQGYKIESGENKIDSAHIRFIAPIDRRGEFIAHLESRYGTLQGSVVHMREMMSLHISPFKMWNASLIGAILFGMISMTLIYRNLGQGVFADASSATLAAAGNTTPKIGLVLGDSDSKDEDKEPVKIKNEEKKDVLKEEAKEIVEGPTHNEKVIVVAPPKEQAQEQAQEQEASPEVLVKEDAMIPVEQEEKKEETKKAQKKSVDAVIVNGPEELAAKKDAEEKRDVPEEVLPVVESAYEAAVKEMVKGYPIERMLPYLFQKDPTVAAYYIAIAKVESNWGKRVPVLNGQDCYNYVGYRGQRKHMGSGGHTCFNSRKDAVDTISKRIDTLVNEYDRKTPAQMVVWKCGSSCAGHGSSAQRWIDHVGGYFHELTKHI